MLNKEDAVKRIMEVTWEMTLEEPAHVRASRKDHSREVVRSCIEGYAESMVYIFRNKMDVAVNQALDYTLKDNWGES